MSTPAEHHDEIKRIQTRIMNHIDQMCEARKQQDKLLDEITQSLGEFIDLSFEIQRLVDPLPEEGAYGFNLDKSRLPTDWVCFRNLCQSIVIHFDKHPEEVLWSTDDNGQHHDPPRTPRIGWVAENQKGEHTSEWTITMSTLKKSDLLHLANTALGRRTLLAQLQEIEPGKL